MKPEKAHAVLVGYKRPQELTEIVHYLRGLHFIGDVHIHINSEEENLGVWARYHTILERVPTGAWVYTQDDDCIVHELDILWAGAQSAQDRLTVGIPDSHWGRYAIHAIAGRETLVGWGAFFKMERVWALSRYIDRWRDYDQVIRTCADRIFTIMQPERHNIYRAQISNFPSAEDPSKAMYLQPGYKEAQEEMHRRLAELA